MVVNCDYTVCSDECRYYTVCNLYEPVNSSLIKLKGQLSWLGGRLNCIDESIIHYNTLYFQFKHGKLSPFIMKYVNMEGLQKRLDELNSERVKVIDDITSCEVRIKNISRILERRRQALNKKNMK